MRPVDADVLFNYGKYKLADAIKYGNKDGEQQDFSYSTLMMYEIAGEIDSAPTLDVAPVVRCRDCELFIEGISKLFVQRQVLLVLKMGFVRLEKEGRAMGQHK